MLSRPSHEIVHFRGRADTRWSSRPATRVRGRAGRAAGPRSGRGGRAGAPVLYGIFHRCYHVLQFCFGPLHELFPRLQFGRGDLVPGGIRLHDADGGLRVLEVVSGGQKNVST